MNSVAGLLWLRKKYEERGRQRLSEENIDCAEIQSKMGAIERRILENCDSLNQLPKKFEQEIDSRMSSLQQVFDDKFNKILAKQGEFPVELKQA